MQFTDVFLSFVERRPAHIRAIDIQDLGRLQAHVGLLRKYHGHTGLVALRRILCDEGGDEVLGRFPRLTGFVLYRLRHLCFVAYPGFVLDGGLGTPLSLRLVRIMHRSGGLCTGLLILPLFIPFVVLNIVLPQRRPRLRQELKAFQIFKRQPDGFSDTF